jgi:DNA-binding NarL/FixJ family response regulator
MCNQSAFGEDHVIVRKGIRTILGKDEQIQIVDDAQDG